MHMYAPLYLSNECLTTCVYCGFARELAIARKTLTPEQTLAEARYLLRQGFRSILLLTGEHQRLTGVEFLEERIRLLAREVPSLAVEVQVWSEDEYRRHLVQLVCALRLALPDAGIVISAREAPELRDGLFRIGVTHTSAGSHAEPGGYTAPNEATEQFEVSDLRSPAEVAARLRELGYEPVWEDWSSVVPATESMLSVGEPRLGRLR